MDPVAALRALIEDGSEDHGEALSQWLKRGGAQPSITTPTDSTLWMVGMRHGLVTDVWRGTQRWRLDVHFFGGRRLVLDPWDVIVEAAPPDAPLLVTCPNCQALPGEPCTAPTSTGRRPVTWLHFSREDALRNPGAS